MSPRGGGSLKNIIYMAKIRILQIMPEFGLAGAEIMCESLIYQLKKNKDIDISVASLYNYKSAITKRLEDNGIKVYYLNKKKGLDFTIIFRLYRLMKQLHVDTIHTHRYVMQYAIPAAVMAGIPGRVHTVHNIATKEVGRYQRTLANFFYKFANVIPVAISPVIRRTIVEEYGLDADKVPMIFNGSNLDLCIPHVNYSCEASREFSFLHIGRLNNQKNQSLIIHAVHHLKEEGVRCHVDFIGQGENLESYLSLARELGVADQVSFGGTKSNVYPSLHKADAFLLPSVYEGMPISLIEAMGTGLPIIASKVGGIPDMIVDKESGLLIEPVLDELVSAMKNVIFHSELREKLGLNALKRAREFSSLKMAEEYYRLYQNH